MSAKGKHQINDIECKMNPSLHLSCEKDNINGIVTYIRVGQLYPQVAVREAGITTTTVRHQRA